MFGSLSAISCVLAVVSAVSGLVVPRATPPSGWDAGLLEPYDDYHCRYLAISCYTQHNTPFFDQCCHPLLAGESISSRPDQCQLPSDVTCSNGRPVTDGPSPITTNTPSATVDPTPTDTPTPTPTTSDQPEPTTSAAPTPTPAPTSGGSDLVTGGFATYFYQDGTAGACGNVNPDSAFIAAIDQDRYGDSSVASSLCGKQIMITNVNNGNTVTVTVADDCPTCTNSNSIDLSVAAFQSLDNLEVGEFPIKWKFV